MIILIELISLIFYLPLVYYIHLKLRQNSWNFIFIICVGHLDGMIKHAKDLLYYCWNTLRMVLLELFITFDRMVLFYNLIFLGNVILNISGLSSYVFIIFKKNVMVINIYSWCVNIIFCATYCYTYCIWEVGVEEYKICYIWRIK